MTDCVPIVVSEKTSRVLQNIAVLCSFFVVMIHCEWPFQIKNSVIHACATDGFCRLAVPFFFFVSGFFLFGHADHVGWWKSEIRKRIGSLLIPYVIWSLLYALVLNAISIYQTGRMLPHDAAECIKWFGFYPFAPSLLGALWYIRSLFIFVVLSGLIARFIQGLAKKTGWGWLPLAIVAVAYLALGHWEFRSWDRMYFFFRKFFSIQGLFYLVFGASVRLGYIRVLDMSKRTYLLSTILGLILMGLKIALNLHESALYSYCGWLSIPFLLVGLLGLAPDWKLPNWLKTTAFPTFILHMFVINLLKLVVHVSGFHGLVLVTALTVLGCWVSYLTISYCAGPLNIYLWGGRGLRRSNLAKAAS